MTTEDLIARLRDTTALSDPLLTHEAADALEALGREVARLSEVNADLQRHTLQPQCYVQDSANRHWVTWQAAYKLGRNAGLDEAVAEASHWQTLSSSHKCGFYIAAAIESLKDNTP